MRINPAGALVFAVAAAMPRRAEACMTCMNDATAIQYPFVGVLIGAFVFWIVASYFFHGWRHERKPDNPKDAVNFGVRCFTFVGIPVLLFGVLILNPLGLGFFVVLIWMIYLLSTTMSGFTKRRQDLSITKSQFRLNLLSLLIVAVAIPTSYARARSTDGLISWLGHAPPHFSHTSRILISGLIEQGGSAIDPLVEALDAELQQPERASQYRISQISFCLGQIGGDEAESALKRVVSKHTLIDETGEWRGKVVAYCSYAECAGERAVPTLLRVFNDAEGKNAAFQKAVALCALTRPRNADAGAFVLDNYEVLIKQREEESFVRWPDSMISLTVQALAEGTTAVDLVSSPIYRQMIVGIDIQYLKSPSRRSGSQIDWNDNWNSQFDVDVARTHWSQVLQ